jgi:hypothetical protein
MKKILLFLLIPIYSLSQSSLSGTIKDSSGYPIMGANDTERERKEKT